MAIISRRYGFIYVHVPKTGGTSIDAIFKNKEDVSDTWNWFTLGDHVIARRIKEEIPDEYDKMFKFTTIRNPLDLMVSLWCYVRKEKRHNLHEEAMKDFPEFINTLYMRRSEDFGEWTPLFQGGQFNWIADEDNKIIIDKIIPMDNIQAGIDEVTDKVGLPRVVVPHINTTVHEKSSTYYTKRAVRQVEEMFELDYRFLGFKSLTSIYL